MEAICPSEWLVPTYKRTQRHNPKVTMDILIKIFSPLSGSHISLLQIFSSAFRKLKFHAIEYRKLTTRVFPKTQTKRLACDVPYYHANLFMKKLYACRTIPGNEGLQEPILTMVICAGIGPHPMQLSSRNEG
jgi:hypothetical protein